MKQFFRSIGNAFTSWMKSVSFKIQLYFFTRAAINDCNGDRRKRWLVRGKTTYITFTDGMVQLNKKLDILDPSTNAKKMDEIADRVIIWDSANQQAKIFGDVRS